MILITHTVNLAGVSTAQQSWEIWRWQAAAGSCTTSSLLYSQGRKTKSDLLCSNHTCIYRWLVEPLTNITTMYWSLLLHIIVSDAYRPVKVHVVGDDADVGMKDLVLVDYLLQDVPNTSWEDQQRDVVLVQEVEKPFVAVPEGEKKKCFLNDFHLLLWLCKSFVLWFVMRMMRCDMCRPQHGVGFPHSLWQQVFPDLLLDQQLVDFSPPAESNGQKKIFLYAQNEMQNKAKTGNLMLNKSWMSNVTYHSTIRGSFSSAVLWGSISIG